MKCVVFLRIWLWQFAVFLALNKTTPRGVFWAKTGRISLENLKKVANEFGDTISGEDKETADQKGIEERGKGIWAGLGWG